MGEHEGPASSAYTHGYNQQIVEYMATRKTDVQAAFFLPYLRPGMRLLDVGCGPGTITIGLAAAVAPGEVLGIDREPSQVERARVLAREKGIANVRFEVGNAEELPFPDGSFDAAFEHTLLEHVADPARVVREMFRVLKPSGVIGVADGDLGCLIDEPSSEEMKETIALYERLWRHNGGDMRLGRRNRSLLREAGFTQILTTSRSVDIPVEFEAFYFSDGLLSARLGDPITALGWADRATLERYAQAWADWGQNPDAVSIALEVQSVGQRK
jgi:ubiquinone/menaquinone biosynthesis C-methylase UbiE